MARRFMGMFQGYRVSHIMKSWLFAALLAATISPNAIAAAKGNPLKGAEIFQQCVACHAIGDDAQNGVGPVLNHVFGRQAGAAEEFEYSDAMVSKGVSDSLVWDEQSLYTFLAGPERFVPGTIMAFEGLRTEKQIKDLLAYLIPYSPAYEPGSGKIVPANIASSAALPEKTDDSADEEMPEFSDTFMASTEALMSGGELWAKQCRHCHGNAAYPGKAPKLKPSGYKPEFVFNRVTNGFRKMPAWKTVFTLEERKNIVAYVLSNKFAP